MLSRRPTNKFKHQPVHANAGAQIREETAEIIVLRDNVDYNAEKVDELRRHALSSHQGVRPMASVHVNVPQSAMYRGGSIYHTQTYARAPAAQNFPIGIMGQAMHPQPIPRRISPGPGRAVGIGSGPQHTG